MPKKPSFGVSFEAESDAFANKRQENKWERQYPHLSNALEVAAALIRDQWASYTTGASIPGTPLRIHSTGAYTNSLKIEKRGKGEMRVYTDFPYESFIEQGSPAHDLKPGLLSGPKARRSASGSIYNIVAFKHGGPNNRPSSMPLKVFNFVNQYFKGKKSSQILSSGGKTVESPTSVWRKGSKAGQPRTWGQRDLNEYAWGARLKGLPKGFPFRNPQVSQTGYKWKVGKYDSMVKMAKTSAAKSAGYITFRTVSSNSATNSWWVPTRQGIPIRQIVLNQVKPAIDKMFKDAIDLDLS